jgi:NADH-quinone oxidoreductase subunit N
MINADLSVVAPELVLAVFAMLALMYAVYRGKDAEAPLLFWLTAIVLAGLGAWIGLSPNVTETAFNGAFVNDGYARFLKVMILFSAAIVLFLSQPYLKRNKLLQSRWRRSA